MLVPNLTLFPGGYNNYFKHIITNNLVVLTTKVVVEEAKKTDCFIDCIDTDCQKDMMLNLSFSTFLS